MMKKSLLRAIAFVMFLSLPVLLISGEIRVTNGSTSFKNGPSSYQEFTFRAEISSVLFREVETKLGPFTELFVKDFGYSNEVGSPKLPVFRRLIESPADAEFEIRITKQEFTEYDLSSHGITSRLIPAQASVSKAITDPDDIPFVIDEQAYQKNEFLGGPLVSVAHEGTMRAINLSSISVSPVWYNPVTGRIRVYSLLEGNIVFRNANVPATTALKQKYASPYFEKAYRMIANYTPVTDELITSAPVTYVIVSDPMFQQALQPLVYWKTRKGFKVIQAYTNNPAVGTTLTSIKAYLQGLYNNPPAGYTPPSFILFVGDVAQIPAWTSGGQPTDLRYCEYTGDNIPEVYYGRFSASSVSQVEPQVDKTVEYEQYLFPNPNFLDTCTMVAGADASHQLTWGNGQINYGTTYYFNTAHGLTSHTYLQPEPSGGNYSQNIHLDVSHGECYSNYTAHGSTDGWADPGFSIYDIPALQNAHMYPLMVGNCCLTMKYDVNCFGEELLRANQKGALGYIGASNNSYWDEDFWWACGLKSISANPSYNPLHLGAYDKLFHDQGEAVEDWFVTQGQMVVGGNLAVQESGSGMKTYYWEIYGLMGDPSLSVYFSVPPQLQATYSSTIFIGTTTLNVVTEPYAYIGLSWNDTSFVAAQCADSLGNALLSFDALTQPGMLDIVITKQNRKPVLDSIQVIPASGPYLVVSTYAVNDSIGGNNDHNADYSENITLNVTVTNVGIQTATGISATFTASDTNIIITDNTFTLDSIPSGQTLLVPDAFALTVKNNVPDQHRAHCTVQFASDTNSWSSPLILNLNAPRLITGTISVLDPAPGGNNNGVLDPGESAVLKVPMVNTGHADAGNGIGHLVALPGSTPYIIPLNNSYYIGDLPVNGNTFALFNVITNGITPTGTTVELDYTGSAGMQNQYSVQHPYNLVIGQIPQYIITNGTQSTCIADFYDSGGPDNGYLDNEDFTMTFNPSTPGAKLQVVFNAFDVEPQSSCSYDYLQIYDGNGTGSPLLGTWCGTDSPDSVASSDAAGALTFKFHSDYSVTLTGWAARIKCFGGPLTLLANAFPPQVCLGNSTQLTVIPSGGTGNYTYLWQPSTYLDDPTIATPVCTPAENISYTVTVYDGTSSLTSSSVDVTVLPAPEPATITIQGGDLVSSVATGNQWYLNGAMIPGANQQTYSPEDFGAYYVTLTDAITGCTSAPSNIIAMWPTGIGAAGSSAEVVVFPNPSHGPFTIRCVNPTPGKVRIELMDSYGKTLKMISDESLGAGDITINSSAGTLSPGLYYLRIQTGSYTVTRKLILTK